MIVRSRGVVPPVEGVGVVSSSEQGFLDADGDGFDDRMDLDSVGEDGLDFGGGVPPMEKHSELLKGLTNFDDFYKVKFNEWLAITWDEESKSWKRNAALKPIMNLHCATWLISFLKTYARDNNIITHVSKDDYLDLRDDLVEVLWLNVGTRQKEFGIESYGDVIRVCVEVQNSAELCLMGAGDGKYNLLLKDTVRQNESSSIQSAGAYPPQKKGFFRSVGDMFRKDN